MDWGPVDGTAEVDSLDEGPFGCSAVETCHLQFFLGFGYAELNLAQPASDRQPGSTRLAADVEEADGKRP